MPPRVRLFVKPYCGWCHQARNWLNRRGIRHQTLDVIADAGAAREMRRLSGQTLAPVIEVEGRVLADFDPLELAEFWQRLELERRRANEPKACPSADD